MNKLKHFLKQKNICMNEAASLLLNGSSDEAKINNLKNSVKYYFYGKNQLEYKYAINRPFYLQHTIQGRKFLTYS